MHVSKLQKLWLNLNEESFKIDHIRLLDTLLMIRILSTTPSEYLDFRTTWKSLPLDQCTVAYLLERLNMVELRVSRKQNDERGFNSSCNALVAKGGNDIQYVNKPKKDYSKLRSFICKEIDIQSGNV